jgi:hypothetical protein
MKTSLAAAAALTMIAGTAFAQNSGPAPQSDTMNKPGSTSGTTNNGAGATGATTPGTTSGTTGASTGMSGGGMAGGSMNKANSSMKKGTSR